MHIHVVGPDGEAKFWLAPIISLSQNSGFSPRELRELQGIIEEHEDEIARAWKKHFSR